MKSVLKLWSLLTAAQQRSAIGLVGLMVVGMLLEADPQNEGIKLLDKEGEAWRSVTSRAMPQSSATFPCSSRNEKVRESSQCTVLCASTMRYSWSKGGPGVLRSMWWAMPEM